MNPRCQSISSGNEGSIVVRVEGLEPPWIAPPDPKSGMSTNFTTPAFSCQLISQAFRPFPSQFRSLTLKKGVQIYRYFVSNNEFFRNSSELVKVIERYN